MNKDLLKRISKGEDYQEKDFTPNEDWRGNSDKRFRSKPGSCEELYCSFDKAKKDSDE